MKLNVYHITSMYHLKKYQRRKFRETRRFLKKNSSERTREALVCNQKYQSQRFLQNEKQKEDKKVPIDTITTWLF